MAEPPPDLQGARATEELASDPGRRRFLAGATAVGVAATAPAAPAAAQTAGTDPPAAPPSAGQLARERTDPDAYSPDELDRYFVARPGSDFMVDVIKSLGIDYVASNPGSSFRGLHESIVNYGGNASPSF